MTLGIGYQGVDSVTLLTDSMEFLGDQMTPSLGGDKILWSGPRVAYVISGFIPRSPAPDVSTSGVVQAGRALAEWIAPLNQDFNPDDGHSWYVLVAGGKDPRPSLAVLERIRPPRVADVGDVVIVGAMAPDARRGGLERNYGVLSDAEASQVLGKLAEQLWTDLCAEHGCSDLEDFPRKLNGAWPAIAPPFHLTTIEGVIT